MTPEDQMEPAPTKPLRDMTIEEKLEVALEMAKKKLNVTEENEVFKFISFNNRNRISAKQRKNLRKDPLLCLNTLILQILDRQPIEYPLRNPNKSKPSLEVIKTYAMAGDIKKIRELFELPSKITAKYELTKAIKKENKDAIIYWFEKLKQILFQ